MNRKLKYAISIPKSFFFSLRFFPLKDAIKLPLLIAYNTRIGAIGKNSKVIAKCPIKTGLFRLGFTGVKNFNENKKCYFSMTDNAELILYGWSRFGEGSTFTIEGTTIIGDNVAANNNFHLSCHTTVEIGSDTMIGWDVRIMDSDNHDIIDVDGNKKCSEAPIIIGKHVWVCSLAHILKGSRIPNDCVVSYRSLVTRPFENEKTIIGGCPAKEISKITTWTA